MTSAMRVMGLLLLASACGPKVGAETEGTGAVSSSETADGSESPSPGTTTTSTADSFDPTFDEVTTTTSELSTDETADGGVPDVCVEEGWLASHETFTTLAAAAENTYWYTVEAGGDTWFSHDCVYRTTISVENEQVVRRAFVALGPPESDPDLECEPGFIEGADEIGTHDALHAAAARTLESLYSLCCWQVLIQPPEEYFVSFGVDEDGIMRYCEYSLKNCADGCTFGPNEGDPIAIAAVGFGPLAED